MKKLHPTQQKLLEILKVQFEDPLTIREIQSKLDLSSPSVVHHHIQDHCRFKDGKCKFKEGATFRLTLPLNPPS